MTEPVFFNPLEPGYLDDPYPQLARLREEDPVHGSPLGIWVLSRYDDVFALLRNPATSVEDDNISSGLVSLREQMFEQIMTEVGGEDRTRRGRRGILNLDPPDHTRLRKLVSKAFTVRRIEGLRPRVQELVDQTLDRVAGSDWDVIDELAFPLPFQVISELLGMPEGDRDQIREWSQALTKTLDPIVGPDEVRAAFVASDAMVEYLAEVTAWKREHPADDLFTALIDAEEDGDRMTPEELRDQVVLLYIAGHETTVNLIGNGLLALLRHPDEYRRWHADPALDADAVDELLRYDSPVQLSRRITMRDTDLGDGTVVPAGTFVMTSLASANRDPAKWGPTADRVDLGRSDGNQHVAFGSGIHFCLGAALARLEGQVALGSIVRRFPDLELAADPVRNGRITLRGLSSLPVRA